MIENIVQNERLLHPIELPDSAYVASLKDFGGDELLAGGIDIGATALVNAFANPLWKNYALPFVGPVFEKGVFFVRHAVRAANTFRTTPVRIRQPFSFYLKAELKGGSDNLMKDLIFHDPLYIGGMAAGLHFLPDVPPYVLSALIYSTAVLGVAGIDVGKNTLLFKRKKKILHQAGFESEKFYEARFFVDRKQNPDQALEGIIREFQLGKPHIHEYHDTYFETSLPVYNSRKPRMRFRSRQKEGDESYHSVQIVYTKANERKKGIDQVRYFVVEKEKIYFLLDEPITRVEQTINQLRVVLNRSVAPNPYYSSVSFKRTVASNDELSVCVDAVVNDRPFYLVELKVWKDLTLLQKAMRYVMVECPIVATHITHGKRDLLY